MHNNELTREQALLAQEIRLLVRERLSAANANLIAAEELASLVPLGVKWELRDDVNPFTALQTLEEKLVNLKEVNPTLADEEGGEFLEEEILALASDALMGDL